MIKTSNFTSDMVKYIVDDSNEKVAFSSLSLNPSIRWAKFILTDNLPNGNKQRIPKSEFDNLINTGVFMPIKVAEGSIEEGHENASPIGVITHLKKVKNRIEGLAALWIKERPDDIDSLQELYKSKKPINLSWEVGYSSSSKNKEDESIQDLIDTALQAVTIVGIPAYKGRTIITALASVNEEDNKLDKLEQLTNELAVANDKIKEYKQSVSGLEETISELKKKVTVASNQEVELQELQEFKLNIEAEQDRELKIVEIKTKFSEAKLDKDDEYFTKNIDTLLGMSENDIDFMIQELSAFVTTAQASLPNFKNTTSNKTNIKDLVGYLKEASNGSS